MKLTKSMTVKASLYRTERNRTDHERRVEACNLKFSDWSFMPWHDSGPYRRIKSPTIAGLRLRFGEVALILSRGLTHHGKLWSLVAENRTTSENQGAYSPHYSFQQTYLLMDHFFILYLPARASSLLAGGVVLVVVGSTVLCRWASRIHPIIWESLVEKHNNGRAKVWFKYRLTR